MSRIYSINGPTLVKVKFGAHATDSTELPENSGSLVFEMGLAPDAIRISPMFSHKDFETDNFPTVPPDVFAILASMRISMTLINQDPKVIDYCITQAFAGETQGVMPGAMLPLGNNKAIGVSGNYFVSLGITATDPVLPWTFPATHLISEPVEIPLGSKASATQLTFRAIPYGRIGGGSEGSKDVPSRGAILYTRTEL